MSLSLFSCGRMAKALLVPVFLAIVGCGALDTGGETSNDDETAAAWLGKWKAANWKTNLAEWNGVSEAFLHVYGLEPESRKASQLGRQVKAELFVKKADGLVRLADDTLPVFIKEGVICFGPSGSRYEFRFQLKADQLRFDLVSTRGGAYWKGTFLRVSKEPGAPQFPQLQPVW